MTTTTTTAATSTHRATSPPPFLPQGEERQRRFVQRQEDSEVEIRSLLRPDMPFRRRWDAVMLLLVAFAIVTLPLRLAFQAHDLPYPPCHAHRATHAAAAPRAFQADIDNQSETTFWVWLVIDVCNDVLWFADIAFNFRTGTRSDASRTARLTHAQSPAAHPALLPRLSQASSRRACS